MILGLLIVVVFATFIVSAPMGFLLAWVPALAILGIVMVALIAHQPKYALFLTLLMSFFQSGLSRYVPIFTWGLTVDLLLLLC